MLLFNRVFERYEQQMDYLKKDFINIENNNVRISRKTSHNIFLLKSQKKKNKIRVHKVN